MNLGNVRKRCKTDEDIVHYAKKLQEKGAVNVLISMAGDERILSQKMVRTLRWEHRRAK